MQKTVFQIIHPLSCKYKEMYGEYPTNLSDWDSSAEFISQMEPILKAPKFGNLMNYYYAHMLDDREALLDSLGFSSMVKDCNITANGTSSLLLLSSWLDRNHIKELNVVGPRYFSIIDNCKSYRIGINFLGIEDFNDEEPHHDKVFLFTNPCFSLGQSISQEYLDVIGKLLEHNWVVVDECLANKGEELSHIFGNHPHFIGIYTPHKSVCLNGLKFSLIVFPKEYGLLFAQSVDYLCGAICTSSLCGVKHYLSDNYDIYYQQFMEAIHPTHLFVEELVANYPAATYAGDGRHYFATIFFPQIDAGVSRDEKWLWSTIEKSGALFIPGYYNGYSDDLGFCFRINLTRDLPGFRRSLRNLLDVLQHY